MPDNNQQPPYDRPAPPPRSHTKTIIVAAAVVAVIILAVAVLYMVNLAVNVEKQTLFEGAELDYTVTGNVTSTPVSGSIEMVITNVTTDGYLVEYIWTGVPGLDVETQWFPLTDKDFAEAGVPGSSSNSSYGTLVDREHMSTILGDKEVDHYRNSTTDPTIDQYITTDKQLPVEMKVTYANGDWMQFDLSYTNILYYKG